MVERPQAVPAVEWEAALAGAEDSNTPVALVGELLERRQERLDRARVSDRVAGDDRDAGNHRVGEESVTVRAEEVRLVRPEDERRQRVPAMLGHERPCSLLLVFPPVTAVAPRRQPAREKPESAGDAEQEDGQREPVAEWPAQVGRASWIESCERRHCLAECKAERVRPIGFDPVDPERRGAVGEDRNRVDERAEADLRPRRRIAVAVEVVTTRDESERERGAHRGLLVVQPLENVQHRRHEHERDRQLPGAATASPKTSREHD